MNLYDNYSKEDLLKLIEQLKQENEFLSTQIGATAPMKKSNVSFKEKYATKILDSLPDMLTVISHSGTLVDLVSSEETNHVGQTDEIIGQDISAMLPPEAYKNVKANLNKVITTNQCSIAHHELIYQGDLHHYENRIFPLDNDYVLCMCRDVTEAANSKSELELANYKMKLAEKIASLSHWYFNIDTQELESSGLIPSLLGVTKEIVKCPIWEYLDHVHPDDVSKLLKQLNGQNIDDDYVEHRVFSSEEGKTRYLHTRVIRTYKKDGVKIVEGYVQDMTYVVERLHEFETVKYAVNNAVEEIYACTLDGTLEFANRQFIASHDLKEPISQYKIYDLFSPKEKKEQWLDKISEIKKCGGTLNYSSSFVQPDGKKVFREIASYIIQDHTKEEVIWFFSRDITVRTEQENKIKELNDIMDAILNNIPVYLFVKDPANDFRYLYWNKAFEEHSHIPASAVLGRTDYEVFPEKKNADKFRKDDLDVLNTGQRLEYLEDYITATGEKRIVTTSKALVPSENKVPLIIGVSWDVTELKNTEKELITARVKAEESDRLKTAFLANMSHEIRTPLNAIVGFSKLVVGSNNEEDKQQYSTIIDRNSEMLLQLINDILDISKIEAGTLEFVDRVIDLGDLCRNLYEVHKNRVYEGVNLIFDNGEDHLKIEADQNRISQVITNLITNACKFTYKGEIRFGFELNVGMIDFYVCDTGVGIPNEKVKCIFDRFTKLNNFAQGTGLGLAISKMIVEKIGGHIGVESEEGKGSIFHFSIPYRNAEAEIPIISVNEKKNNLKVQESVSRSGKKVILIAEDVESNYLLLEAGLGKIYTLLHAKNGMEAVELFKTHHPDLILMDIKMPDMDGLEATRIIKDIRKDIPIIALTAFAFESDKEDALTAGCDNFVTKPVSISFLVELLDRYI